MFSSNNYLELIFPPIAYTKLMILFLQKVHFYLVPCSAPPTKETVSTLLATLQPSASAKLLSLALQTTGSSQPTCQSVRITGSATMTCHSPWVKQEENIIVSNGKIQDQASGPSSCTLTGCVTPDKAFASLGPSLLFYEMRGPYTLFYVMIL